MRVHLLTLAVAPWLLLGSANAETRRDPTDKGEEVELRYRSLGEGSHELSSAVRYAPTAHLDVGWRVMAQHYSRNGPALAGWQVSLGPLWAYVARTRNRSLCFRAEANPWLAVVPGLHDPATDAPVRVTFGADFSAQLSTSLDFGKRLRVSPGVSVMTKAARSSQLPDPANPTAPPGKFWDRQTGWRFLVPVWLGTQRRLRVEAGYTHLVKQGVYFGPERFTVACGWVF
jgi:hypothetical protein